MLGIALLVGVAIGTAVAATRSSDTPTAAPISATPATDTASLDPGAPLNAVAPAFTLTDQFGKRVSLSSYRGKVVVLAFNDPECTTICPLTTTALLYAKQLLGPAASRVQLLGIGANPDATQVKWVRDYSRVHQMTHKWRFLTGPLPVLRRVWHDYGIEAAVMNGAVDHTPATYVIDSLHGRESRLFLTQMAYSSVDQLGYEIARSIAPLIPGHPRLQSTTSLAAPTLSSPHVAVALPRAGGGETVRFGPGSGPHLVLFFDTWDSEVTDVAKQLEGLNGYAVYARRHGSAATSGQQSTRTRSSRRRVRSRDSSTVYPTRSDIPSSWTEAARSPTGTASRIRRISSSSPPRAGSCCSETSP